MEVAVFWVCVVIIWALWILRGELRERRKAACTAAYRPPVMRIVFDEGHWEIEKTAKGELTLTEKGGGNG